MTIKLLAAALLLAASTAGHATTYRYSWYYDGRGPFFSTPAEVCVWARSDYPPDSYPALTLGLGSDGNCRDRYGDGTVYIRPYRMPVPYSIALQGPGGTKALPAGPVLALSARVTEDGTPVANVGVTVRMEAGGVSGTTDASGKFDFNYTPPVQSGVIESVTATCDLCENTAAKTIVVDPVVESCRFGNPIAPGTGAKVQYETDWLDAAVHPLSVTRQYNSLLNSPDARDAGLASGWTHNWAAFLRVAGDDASVKINAAHVLFNRRGTGAGQAWQTPRGADGLIDTAGGYSYVRAQDETTWRFDAAGLLLDITARNGWRYTLTRDAQGRVATVTNAFGRTLTFSYNASGAVNRAALPGGSQLSYAYDAAARLASVTYPDGLSRGYLYEDSRFPNALTGITDERGLRLASFAYDDVGRALSTQHAGGADHFSISYGQAAGGHGSLGAAGAAADPALYRATARLTSPAGGVQNLTWIGGDGTIRLASASGSANGISVASRSLGAGLSASESDFLGVLTSYQWDPQRELLLSSTRAAGRPEAATSRTQWHPVFRLPVRVERGVQEGGLPTSTVDYIYDSAGNLLSETITDTASGQARTTAWTWNAQGLADTMTDARGGVWRYGYDAAGNRTAVTNTLRHLSSFAYDAAGRVTMQTVPNGLVASFSYDPRGRLTQASLGGEVTRYTYTPFGQIASAALPNGHAVSYSYDAAQRLVAATDNRGNNVQYTLDSAGNRVREETKDASGTIALVTSRVVNSLNQLAALQGATGQTTQLAYDANGEVISQIDPLNQTTRQTLDALRRPTVTTFADSASATQSYNQLDQLTAVTDPKGVNTGYWNNAFGEVVSETSPDIGTVRYERDALGDVVKKTDAKGSITTITRDALGRPTTVQYAPDHIVRYTYDSNASLTFSQTGYLSRIEDKSGTTRYERDVLGRITRKVQTVNDNPRSPTSYKTSYSYAGGELESITYASGLRVIYRRNASGQIAGIDTVANGFLQTLRAAKPFVSNLSYTALQQPRSWTWASGDSASRSFDADGRMTANEFASYTYDVAGRITGITQSLWAETTVNGYANRFTMPFTWTAGYDNRNRLTSFARAGAGTSYTYDANSNRLTSEDARTSDTDFESDFAKADMSQATTRALNVEATSNRLLGFTQRVTTTQAGKPNAVTNATINYSIDENGSMTSDGLRTFEYDESGRIDKVRLMKGAEAASVTYLHNALGQRVFKSEVTADQKLPNARTLGTGFVNWLKNNFHWMFAQAQAEASVGTAYTYADGQLPEWALLGEYDNGSASGTGRAEYIWLPTAGGAIPIGLYRGGRLFAIHSDHLGTSRQMKNDVNKVAWQWPYSGFGNNKPTGILQAKAKPKQAGVSPSLLIDATVPAQLLDLRFPGQVTDDETGSFYNYFRQYDSRTGRYTQSDPIGMDGGWNRFGYVGGNPVNRTDPTGQFVVLLPLIPIAVTGADIAIGAGLGLALYGIDRMFSSGLPPGFIPGDKGAEIWGRNNGVDPNDARGRFHGLKQSDKGRPRDKYGVNPETGEVCNPAGEVVGDLTDTPRK